MKTRLYSNLAEFKTVLPLEGNKQLYTTSVRTNENEKFVENAFSIVLFNEQL